MTTMPPWQRLREVLASDRLVHAPGCHDPVTAKLVEAAGFEVAYLSGAATSAVALGEPDLGFLGMTDMVRHAGLVASATRLPLIADADTGYGNALQARRTVERYRAAGVAGLHLEDQVSPKRCGHMAGKQVIDLGEATARVRAAVDASDGTVVVIARTDAHSVLGLAAATERAVSFAAAGADLVFVEGVAGVDHLAHIHAALPGVGLVLNRSEAAGPSGPAPLPDDVLQELGVRVVIHPVSALLAAARAAQQVYGAIAQNASVGGADPMPGPTSGPMPDRMAWNELTTLIGLDREIELEARYTE